MKLVNVRSKIGLGSTLVCQVNRVYSMSVRETLQLGLCPITLCLILELLHLCLEVGIIDFQFFKILVHPFEDQIYHLCEIIHF